MPRGDVEIDYPAVMGSRERLWAKYGEAWGWPPATMSYEADCEDLARHGREIGRARGVPLRRVRRRRDRAARLRLHRSAARGHRPRRPGVLVGGRRCRRLRARARARRVRAGAGSRRRGASRGSTTRPEPPAASCRRSRAPRSRRARPPRARAGTAGRSPASGRRRAPARCARAPGGPCAPTRHRASRPPPSLTSAHAPLASPKLSIRPPGGAARTRPARLARRRRRRPRRAPPAARRTCTLPSAPSERARSRLASVLAAAMTCAPAAAASWTSSVPTPPAAARTRTRSPGAIAAASASSVAVRPSASSATASSSVRCVGDLEDVGAGGAFGVAARSAERRDDAAAVEVAADAVAGDHRERHRERGAAGADLGLDERDVRVGDVDHRLAAGFGRLAGLERRRRAELTEPDGSH